MIKRWRVTMADKTERTIEARGFRVEGGAFDPQPTGRMRRGLRPLDLAHD
jgi:hypothetical protein